jgi:hypothetical protein
MDQSVVWHAVINLACVGSHGFDSYYYTTAFSFNSNQILNNYEHCHLVALNVSNRLLFRTNHGPLKQLTFV